MYHSLKIETHGLQKMNAIIDYPPSTGANSFDMWVCI